MPPLTELQTPPHQRPAGTPARPHAWSPPWSTLPQGLHRPAVQAQKNFERLALATAQSWETELGGGDRSSQRASHLQLACPVVALDCRGPLLPEHLLPTVLRQLGGPANALGCGVGQQVRCVQPRRVEFDCLVMDMSIAAQSLYKHGCMSGGTGAERKVGASSRKKGVGRASAVLRELVPQDGVGCLQGTLRKHSIAAGKSS